MRSCRHSLRLGGIPLLLSLACTGGDGGGTEASNGQTSEPTGAPNPTGAEPGARSTDEPTTTIGSGASSVMGGMVSNDDQLPSTSGGDTGPVNPTDEQSNTASGGVTSGAPTTDTPSTTTEAGSSVLITTEPDSTLPVDNSSNSSSRLRAVPVGTTEVALGFWEYLPPNYGDSPVPLLVFTHGASWQGAGTEETLQKLLEVGPPNLISTDNWPNSRPFIVLAPQNPHSGCFTSEDIDALYTYALANYNVDTKRIYHTGQSCGAIGSWNYLADHLDEHVTAAVLISGDGRDAFAKAGCDLGKVAIWGLHNEKDGTVSSDGTIEPLNALMDCVPKPDVKLTIYPDATEHDAWTKTYDLSAGNDIYSWLLEHQHP